METEDREKGEAEIENFYNKMKGWVSGWTYAFILRSGLEELKGDDWYPDDHELNVSAKAYLDFADKVGWYRQIYIEAFENVLISSQKRDFVLQEGDILFEYAGTCADLQKQIDENYYALPVDAPENKNGSYMAKDQRHEYHIILNDPNAPVYRLKMSQRVLDELDGRNELSVYFLDQRTEGDPLMIYYGNVSYDVYQVCEVNGQRGEWESVSPEYLFFFGTYESVPYGDQ